MWRDDRSRGGFGRRFLGVFLSFRCGGFRVKWRRLLWLQPWRRRPLRCIRKRTPALCLQVPTPVHAQTYPRPPSTKGHAWACVDTRYERMSWCQVRLQIQVLETCASEFLRPHARLRVRGLQGETERGETQGWERCVADRGVTEVAGS